MAICSDDLEALEADRWIEHHYDFDAHRNSPPQNRFVFHGLTLKARELVYAVGHGEQDAQKRARLAWERKDCILTDHEPIPHDEKLKGSLRYSYHAAKHSLTSLLYPHGLFAGLPWFFQTWARDAAISLPALADIGHIKEAKTLLFKLIDSIGADGLIQSCVNPLAGPRVFDGVGWIFHSARYLLDNHASEFTGADRQRIISKLLDSIEALKKTHIKDSLLYTGPLGTCMDSSCGGDDRAGARIEHQALFLAMLSFKIKEGHYDPLEKEMSSKVRYVFFRNNSLYDGQDDPTIRPNIFLAYKAYPALLKTDEWESCFDSAIPKLWCSWGGLSSIDTSNPLFIGISTGEDSTSYHRGDSWYWINNVAAGCMWDLDKKKYQNYINKIILASTKDILSLGALGHHSEVSSAHNQTGSGCLSQAWSMAAYLDLIKMIHQKK